MLIFGGFFNLKVVLMVYIYCHLLRFCCCNFSIGILVINKRTCTNVYFFQQKCESICLEWHGIFFRLNSCLCDYSGMSFSSGLYQVGFPVYVHFILYVILPDFSNLYYYSACTLFYHKVTK